MPRFPIGSHKDVWRYRSPISLQDLARIRRNIAASHGHTATVRIMTEGADTQEEAVVFVVVSSPHSEDA